MAYSRNHANPASRPLIMSNPIRFRATVLAWIAAFGAILLMLWASGLFSVTGKPKSRITQSAEIVSVTERAWEIRLANGKTARLLVPKPSIRKPGDRIVVQVVTYDTGRIEAVYLGR